MWVSSLVGTSVVVATSQVTARYEGSERTASAYIASQNSEFNVLYATIYSANVLPSPNLHLLFST